MSPRLLLVEFITVDRFHRALSFPFVKGWAQRQGIATSWLRFALRASVQFEQGSSGIALGAAERDTLARELLDTRPTHVLFDRPPAPELAALVRRMLPEAVPGFLSPEAGSRAPAAAEPAAPCPPLALGTGAALGDWLGLPGSPARPGDGGNLFESAVPDFGWTAGNGLARTCQPLPFLICGQECSFSLPLRSNPFYAGVDLRAAGFQSGCAFCVRPRGGRPWPTPPLELARRQLRAIRDTHPPFPVRPAIRVLGEAPFVLIDRFAGMLAGLKLPPADFLFDARADRLLAGRERLLAALRTVRGTGHRLHVCLVGIENFSAAELARLNKGTTPAANLAAIAHLLRLEREHPDTFGVREHGGLSMITFTPWTTLKDLLINTALFKELRLDGLCGKFLTARVRLYPELPLTLLARRDRLLVDRYRDPLLDTAKRNFYPDEMPWRFRHPQVEAVNRIFTRLRSDPALARDPLYGNIQSWLDALPGARQDLGRVAFAVASAAARGGRAPSPARLLAGGRGAFGRPGRGDPGTAYPGNRDVRAEIDGSSRSLAQFEQEMGLKPVRRIEAVDARHLALCRARPRIFQNLQAYRPPEGLGPAGQDVFFGPEAEAVAEAAALTSEYQRGAAKDPLKRTRLVIRIGALLGYPGCCSRAFADSLSWTLGSNDWLWLARRLENPGRILVEMHPRFLQYVPCSTACAHSADRARRVLEARAVRDGADALRLYREMLHRPYFMLLDAGQETGVSLLPETGPAARFRYRAGDCFGQAARLRAVCESDEMLLEPGCITLLRRGREHAYYPSNAFLWWSDAVIQAEFWRPYLALKILGAAAAPAPAPDPAQEEVRPAPLSLESLRLKDLLSAMLSRADPSGRRFAGFEVGSMRPQPRQRLEVTLKKGRETLILFVSRRTPALPAYAEAGGCAVNFASDTPLDSPGKAAAVRAFARSLKGLAVGT